MSDRLLERQARADIGPSPAKRVGVVVSGGNTTAVSFEE
jgi:hypothetical protein